MASYSIENWPQFPRLGDVIWQWQTWQPLDLSATGALLVFATDGKWGFLHRDGSLAIKARFERARPFGIEVQLAPVRVRKTCGYLDDSGRMAIAPQFEVAQPFVGRLAVVRQAGRWGLIDPVGAWVAEPRFDK